MMRSLLSTVAAFVGGLLLYLGIPVIIVGVASAILLGIGTLLSRWFAVSVFEATVIVTLAAIPLVWGWARLLNNLGYTGSEVEGEEEAEAPRSFEPLIIMPRAARRRKKKPLR